MQIWIKPSELIYDHSQAVPIKVQDKMLLYHISQANPIRDKYMFPIWASKRSGFRSKDHEKAMGREPDGVTRLDWSRHTFEPCPGDAKGKGATDWTCYKKNRLRLGLALWQETDYHRISVYSWGFHSDYKNVTGHRQLIVGNGWQVTDADGFVAQIKAYL